ncbi:MAG: ABC transporter permease [Acidobacteriota bacterium]
MQTLWQDLRYGFRMLRKNPGLTAVAVITLALGIGANTAIFSIVNAVVLRPLPYPEADRLVEIFHAYSKINLSQASVSPIAFDHYRKEVESLEHLAAVTRYRAPENLTEAGNPERVRSAMVSAEFFPALRVSPVLGRTFLAEEDEPGKEHAAVLSFGIWQQRFGGDPGMVGKTIKLDGAAYTVVGILPADFQFLMEADVWLPLAFSAEELRQGNEFLGVIGRLKPGISFPQADAEMDSISAEVRARFPFLEDSGWNAYVLPLDEVASGPMRHAVLILLGAVGFVLLIACVNVANLMLSRALARQKEIGIRTALGANRWRLARQLLSESLVLALMGGSLGLLVGYWGIDLLLSIIPSQIPTLIQAGIRIDGLVLVFTLLLSVATGLLFGAVPALSSAGIDINESLKEGGRTSMAEDRRRLRPLLTVAEVALALVLLIGAGLMIKSFILILQADTGFDPSNVLTFAISLSENKYRNEQQITAFHGEVLENIAGLPGVESVGSGLTLPLSQDWQGSFVIQGRDLNPDPHAHLVPVSSDYFETMRIPLLKGRLFTEADTNESLPVVIIDEVTARTYWPDEDPIGKYVSGISDEDSERWREIVGVVKSVKRNSALSEQIKGDVYVPFAQLPLNSFHFAVRTSGDPLSLAAAARAQVLEIDPEQPIFDIRTMEQRLDEFVAQPRSTMILLGSFAILALVLAAIGIYGVLSYSISQRTHEIGIRMALGARPNDIMRSIVGRGLKLALIGIALGLAAALGLSRFLSSLLYGVSATDPATFVAVSLLLTGIALLASYIPARRATRVDPKAALRYE